MSMFVYIDTASAVKSESFPVKRDEHSRFFKSEEFFR